MKTWTALMLGGFIALVGAPSHAQTQTIHLGDIEDEYGVWVSRGETDPTIPRSIDGNCVGAACGAVNVGAGPLISRFAPPIESSSQLRSDIRDQQFNAFVAGGAGVGLGAFQPGVGSVDDWLVGSANPVTVYNSIQRAIVVGTVFPRGLAWYEPVNAHFLFEFRRRSSNLTPPLLIGAPDVIKFNTLRDLIIQRFVDPAYIRPGGRTPSNLAQIRDSFAGKASDIYDAEYRKGLASLRAAAGKTHQAAAQELGEHVRVDLPDVEAAVSRTSEAAGRLSGVAGASKPIVMDDQSYTAILIEAIDVGGRSYMLSPPLRKGFEPPPPRVHSPNALSGPDTLASATIEAAVPETRQGLLAKALARYFLIQGSGRWTRHDLELLEQNRATALQLLDIGTGFIPLVGGLRDVFEAYYGENVWTGAKLTPDERALRIVFAAYGFARGDTPSEKVANVLTWIKGFPERGAIGSAGKRAGEIAELLGKWKTDSAKYEAYLRAAFDGAANYKGGAPYRFTVASVTDNEADLLGLAWVGSDRVTIRDVGRNIRYESADGLRQYRPANPSIGDVDASLERRLVPDGRWISNAHFPIVPAAPNSPH